VQIKPFGATDLKVSEFGLGCARLGGIFQAHSAGFLEVLSVAHDAGVTFFDTADMYSQGESEQLIGRAFKGKRTQIVIASKAGYCLPARRRVLARLKPVVRPVIQGLKLRRSAVPPSVRGALEQDFSAAHLKSAVEGSLRRLRTDYLDLLQLHSPPRDVVERGDWVEALDELKRAGKVRYYGVSCDDLEAGLAALDYPDVASIQVTLSLLEPGAAEKLLPRAGSQGVGGIARECLANGLLVKRAADVDLKSYCKSPEEEATRGEQLERFRREASAAGRSLPGYALRYAADVPGVSVTLIGVRTVPQLRDLLRQIDA
jgi:aryl-alcohol dehydrogenase-like predicted oxidoreductase